jgi:hypothetical protein
MAFLTAGNVYYIVIDGQIETTCGSYHLQVLDIPTCYVDCPPGAIQENEPDLPDFGLDFTNGGCNNNAIYPMFLPISIGQTYCGHCNTYVGAWGLPYCDSDWYEVVLSQNCSISWEVEAEFDVFIGLVDAQYGCNQLTVLQSATAAPCTPVSVAAAVTAGTYWCVIAPNAFNYPAGGDWQYTASLVNAAVSDDCANATPVNEVSNLAFSTIGASHDGPTSCGYAPNVWYNYTATKSGSCTVDLCGSNYDTKLAIYDRFDCSTMTMLYCNDDGCGWPSFASKVIFPVTAGQQFKIEVGGWQDYTGDGDLTISVAPANDFCASATPVNEVTDLSFNTASATFDGFGACITSKNIWYNYTATQTGTCTVDLCGSQFNTYLGIYDGFDCGPMTLLYCDDNGCGYPWSSVTFPVTTGEELKIEVGGWDISAGPGDLTISVVPANDLCANAEYVPGPYPFTTTGSNLNTTVDCPGVLDYNAVWYEVYLPYTDNKLTIDFCGSNAGAATVGVVYLPDCNSCASYVVASGYEQITCADSSPTMWWNHISGPGTIKFPVYLDPARLFTITFNVENTYCAASSTCDEHIDQVVFNTISNASACGTNGYTDFINLSTTLAPGVPYPITVHNPVAYTGDVVSIWMDFNHNNSFYDAGELFTTTTSDYCTFTGSITVPQNAQPGPTRMRIRLQWTGNPEPCGSWSYGETEDYTVNLLTYCAATSTCDEHIDQVVFNSINNSSSCGTNGYTDFTSISTTLAKGEIYPITIHNPVAYTGDVVSVWIDFNQNLSLYDAGELFTTTTTDYYTFTGSVTIPQTALLGPTRMRIRIQYTGNPEPCGSWYYGETEDYTVNLVTNISVDLYLWLEGPFSAGSDAGMSTSLLSQGLIPLNQPFHPSLPYYGNPNPCWYYSGTESVNSVPASIVDWVLVELRDGGTTGAFTKAKKACFIRSNGKIVALDGVSVPQFPVSVTGPLYATVYHRNHQAVMSSSGLPLVNDNYTWNFKSGSGQYYGGANGAKQLGTNIWGARAGDGNADKQDNNNDKLQVWKIESGSSGYRGGDYDLNGQVNNVDKIDKWKPNSGSSSQVPD